jgi:hypothetical protein
MVTTGLPSNAAPRSEEGRDARGGDGGDYVDDSEPALSPESTCSMVGLGVNGHVATPLSNGDDNNKKQEDVTGNIADDNPEDEKAADDDNSTHRCEQLPSGYGMLGSHR